MISGAFGSINPKPKVRKLKVRALPKRLQSADPARKPSAADMFTNPTPHPQWQAPAPAPNYEPVAGESPFSPRNIERGDRKFRQTQRQITGLPLQSPGETDPAQTVAAKNRKNPQHYASGFEYLRRKLPRDVFDANQERLRSALIAENGGEYTGDLETLDGKKVTGSGASYRNAIEAARSIEQLIRAGNWNQVDEVAETFRERRAGQARNRQLQEGMRQEARYSQVLDNPYASAYLDENQKRALAAGNEDLSGVGLTNAGFTELAGDTARVTKTAFGGDIASRKRKQLKEDPEFMDNPWARLGDMGLAAYEGLTSLMGETVGMVPDVAGDLVNLASPSTPFLDTVGAAANTVGKAAALAGAGMGAGAGAQMIRAGRPLAGAAKIVAELAAGDPSDIINAAAGRGGRALPQMDPLAEALARNNARLEELEKRRGSRSAPARPVFDQGEFTQGLRAGEGPLEVGEGAIRIPEAPRAKAPKAKDIEDKIRLAQDYKDDLLRAGVGEDGDLDPKYKAAVEDVDTYLAGLEAELAGMGRASTPEPPRWWSAEPARVVEPGVVPPSRAPQADPDDLGLESALREDFNPEQVRDQVRADLEKAKRNQPQNAGSTRFPVGDIRPVVNGLEKLAVWALNRGWKVVDFMKEVAKTIGPGLTAMAKSAWETARNWLNQSGQGPSNLQRGALMPQGGKPGDPIRRVRKTSMSQEIMGEAPLPEVVTRIGKNGKPERVKVTDIAKRLNERALKILGKPVELTKENAPKVVDALATVIADEATAIMRMGGRGHGFYSKSIDQVDRLLYQLFPQASNAEVKLFHVLSAPVSNGNLPQQEALFGVQFWMDWMKTRQLPTAHSQGAPFPGLRAPSIEAGIVRLRELFDDFGNDPEKIYDWLTTTHTPAELKKYNENFSPGQHQAATDGKFYGVSILGKKVGVYAGNRIGLPGLVKDLWFYRGTNRTTGTLNVVDEVDKSTGKLKPKIVDDGFMDGNNLATQVANEATIEAGRRLGLDEKEVQELLWGQEQDTYAAMGVPQRSEWLHTGILEWGKRNGFDFDAQPIEDFKWDQRLKERRDAAVQRGSVQGYGLRQSGPGKAPLPGDPHVGEAMVFASPNVLEGTKLKDAFKGLAGSEHHRLKSIANDLVSEHYGYLDDAIGDWADGAENAFLMRFAATNSFEDVRALAADLGVRMARSGAPQKALIPFRADVDGLDAVYEFTLKGKTLEEVRSMLDKAGIQFRTLSKVPGGGTRVSVFDQGAKLGSKVVNLISSAGGTEVRFMRGRGEFLGSWDTRIGGLNEYRKYAKEPNWQPKTQQDQSNRGGRNEGRDLDGVRNRAGNQPDVGPQGKGILQGAEETSAGPAGQVAPPKKGTRPKPGVAETAPAPDAPRVDDPSFRARNEARLAELEARRKPRMSDKRRSAVDIGPEDFEYVARKAVKLAIDTGEEVAKIVRDLFTQERFNDAEQAEALRILDEIIDQEGYDLPRQTKATAPAPDGAATGLANAPAPGLANAPAPGLANAPAPDGAATGFAKQITERPSMGTVSPKDLVAQGEEAIRTGRINPEAVVDQILKTGRPATPEEVGALSVRLRDIANRSDAITRELAGADDPVALSALQTELSELATARERLATAGDITGNEWHKTGRALQIAMKPDYSLAALLGRAKAANLGDAIPEKVKAAIESLSEKLVSAEDELRSLKDRLLTSMKPEPKPMVQKVRSLNISNLQKYFGVSAGTPAAGGGGLGPKTRGALKYTISQPEMDAMRAARALAREAIGSGIDDIDRVVDYIRAQAGIQANDEAILRLLGNKYRDSLLEADVNRRKIDAQMRDLQRAAAFRNKSAAGKALDLVASTLSTTARGMQSGLDFSAPFIQGRKGLFANPKSWFKSIRPMLDSALKGEDAAMRYLSEIEQHPLYPRAQAAGLSLTDIGTSFTRQEELLAGGILELLVKKMPDMGGANPIKRYFDLLDRTNYAYTVFLNRLRYDTFVKLASVAPDEPAYLRDVAGTINTLFGRGDSRVAKAVGQTPLTGSLIYAPRYTVSSWEYATLRPLWRSQTPRGRAQALKIYAAQAATYGSIVALASLAGWEVDTDPRSTDYGKIYNPESKVRVDLFGKESEAHRLITRMLYGSVNEEGKHRHSKSSLDASGYVGRYLQGKLAPSPRLAMDATYGRFDGDETNPLTGQDVATTFLPIWVQQFVQDMRKGVDPVPMDAARPFGLDVSRIKNAKKPPRPLDWTKPGYRGG